MDAASSWTLLRCTWTIGQVSFPPSRLRLSCHRRSFLVSCVSGLLHLFTLFFFDRWGLPRHSLAFAPAPLFHAMLVSCTPQVVGRRLVGSMILFIAHTTDTYTHTHTSVHHLSLYPLLLIFSRLALLGSPFIPSASDCLFFPLFFSLFYTPISSSILLQLSRVGPLVFCLAVLTRN